MSPFFSRRPVGNKTLVTMGGMESLELTMADVNDAEFWKQERALSAGRKRNQDWRLQLAVKREERERVFGRIRELSSLLAELTRRSTSVNISAGDDTTVRYKNDLDRQIGESRQELLALVNSHKVKK